MNVETRHEDTDSWTECPQGTLTGLGRRLAAADQSRKTRVRMAGVFAVVACAALTVLTRPGAAPVVEPDTAVAVAPITCEQCLARMADYSGHLRGDLVMPSESAEQVAAHLATCDVCTQHFNEEYPGLLTSAAAAAGIGFGALATRRRVRG